MENEQSGDIGAFLAGFIIGGLVGAAAAIILAPQSGEETRNRLLSQGTQLREAGTERLHTAQEYVSDARVRAQATASHVQEQARIVLDEGKARLSSSEPDSQASNGEVTAPEEPGETA